MSLLPPEAEMGGPPTDTWDEQGASSNLLDS